MESRVKNVGITAFSNENTGGVLQYTQSLIDILSNYNEFNLVVFVFKEGLFETGLSEVRLLPEPKRNWHERGVMLIQSLFSYRSEWILSEYELSMFSDIDFFISPTNSLYPNFFLKKPFIFTIHDFQERYYPEFFSRVVRFNRWLVKRELSKSSTHIVCESSHVKNDSIKFLKANQSDIFVIPSPPTKLFNEYIFDEKSLMKIRLKYKLPDQYIFYPAQYWKHKNHVRLIYAFEKLSKKNPNLHMVLTGMKTNNYFNIMRLIKKLGVENKIIHLGYVNYSDLPSLYKLSKMLILPTLFESISIPIYEAFSLSVPVCCSNILALPEQTKGAAILFNPSSVDDMVTKIQLLLDDLDLQDSLGKKGKAVMENFNYINYKKKFDNLVLNALSN
jgi:glycosyltransferase involved in cell wall biosynthesis